MNVLIQGWSNEDESMILFDGSQEDLIIGSKVFLVSRLQVECQFHKRYWLVLTELKCHLLTLLS